MAYSIILKSPSTTEMKNAAVGLGIIVAAAVVLRIGILLLIEFLEQFRYFPPFAIAFLSLPAMEIASLILPFSRNEKRARIGRYALPTMMIVAAWQGIDTLRWRAACYNGEIDDAICMALTMHAIFHIPFLVVAVIVSVFVIRKMRRA